jgi:ribosomal protein S18 acetylase RimI-like enzyme
MTASLHLRPLLADDATAVARLHAESWRATYRGLLGDDYLDREVGAERDAAWRERLEQAPRDTQAGVVAEINGELLGFAFIYRHEDPQWGTLIENLHAAPGRHGLGIGRSLLRWVCAQVPPEEPLHLFVYDANAAARRFYDRLGGTAQARMEEIAPDGRPALVWRYVWPAASVLARALG